MLMGMYTFFFEKIIKFTHKKHPYIAVIVRRRKGSYFKRTLQKHKIFSQSHVIELEKNKKKYGMDRNVLKEKQQFI